MLVPAVRMCGVPEKVLGSRGEVSAVGGRGMYMWSSSLSPLSMAVWTVRRTWHHSGVNRSWRVRLCGRGNLVLWQHLFVLRDAQFSFFLSRSQLIGTLIDAAKNNQGCNTLLIQPHQGLEGLCVCVRVHVCTRTRSAPMQTLLISVFFERSHMQSSSSNAVISYEVCERNCTRLGYTPTLTSAIFAFLLWAALPLSLCSLCSALVRVPNYVAKQRQ